MDNESEGSEGSERVGAYPSLCAFLLSCSSRQLTKVDGA